MKLQLDQKYQKNLPFPSENIPQNMKEEKEYFLNCANAIVSKYVRNKCFIPYAAEGQRSIAVLRSYLSGKNSTDKYKDILIGKAGATGKRKTTMNISWDVPQILPEKMDVVKGYIMKLAYEITTSAIDMHAKMDKDLIVANLKLMINDKMEFFGVQLNQAAGREIIPSMKEDMPIPFQNEQQVEMFAQIGGVLLEQESSIKILLDESFMVSDWEGVKDKLTEDILAAATIGSKVYNDAGSDIPKSRYVDIDRAIIPYSQYNDFRDITWAGEIRQMSVAEIRQETGLEKDEIIKIARMYSRDEKGNYTSDFYLNAQQGYRSDGFGMSMIDSLVVDVADVCWIGTCTDTYKKYNRKKDRAMVLEKKTDDYMPSEYSVNKYSTEVEKYTRQCVYKAKLIVGTDYVFDFGKEYNQSYRVDDTGKQVCILPYRFVRTGSTSLVERAIPFVDDLALATYKKRNALKKLPPPPMIYIEKSAFENLEIACNKVSPLQGMKLLQDEGYLIGDTQNAWGQNTTGRNPITQIPSGVLEQLTLFNNEIEFNTRQIERVTGINDIFSGSTPSSETGLGVSKIAINATMNAIYPVVRALETIYEQTARVMAKKWQVSSMGINEPGRKPMPHDRALSYIASGSKYSFNDFMIKIEAGVTDEEKLMLMNDIRALQDVRRQSGVGGIRPSDYVMVYEMIRNGNIKQARLVLAQVEEYIQQLDDAKNAQNQQFNIDSQMKSNQQTADNEIRQTATEEQLQAQREAQNIQLKLQADMILEREKAKNEKHKQAIANVYGWSSDNYNKTAK